jgi:hypothetical protein
MARSTPFSTFLERWCALVGIPVSRLTTELQAVAVAQANTAFSTMWNRGMWLDVCPKGEARFVGNRLTYPNDLTQSSYWTATAVTPTANSVANPADGATTATQLLETAANSAHKVVQSVTSFFPSTEFVVSCYARPNGRGYIQLAANDGVTTYSAFYNITAGTVGTTANVTSSQIQQQPNGFWLCQFTFTSDAAATTAGSVTLSLSTDGATLSYAGDTANGIYSWGVLVQQQSNVPISDTIIPYEQTGEEVIDAVFDVWGQYPFGNTYPQPLGYDLSQQGIQLINGTTATYYIGGNAQSSVYGPSPSNPVFLYYRKQCPTFSGDVFDAADTYAAGEQVYFTNSLSQGDYYKCLSATSAGQDPDDTPSKWRKLPLYEPFFLYVLYQSYSDWLISDGQSDRAMGAAAIAEEKLNQAFDKQERQEGVVPRMRVATHMTSRPGGWSN